MSEAFSRVYEKLHGVKYHPGGVYAKCPAHDDQNASLTMSEGLDGRVLLHCHAGCTLEAIVSSIGLEVADLYLRSSDVAERFSALGEPEAVYPYTDQHGNLEAELLRYPGKQFRWRMPDPIHGWRWTTTGARLLPYNLPAVLSAVRRGETIFIVEGEKDVDALTALGCVATTNPGGAGKWRPFYSEFFRGTPVVVIPDNDVVGREHAQKIAESLYGVASEVRVLDLPGLLEHGDVSDWISSERDLATLKEMADAVAPFEHTANPLVGVSDRNSHIPLQRRLTSVSALAKLPVPGWIVSGFIPEQSLSVLYGPPACGKSFIMVDLACSIARGRPWHGQEVQCGPVVIVAAEGSAHLPKRINAWHEHYGIPNDDPEIFLVPTAVRLLEKSDVELLLTQIDELPTSPRLIFFDTLSLCLGPEGDENSTKDMTALVSLARRIIERSGTSVVLIHHSGKNGTGERGSSALRASADVVIRVEKKGSQVTLKEEKMRDAAGHAPLLLDLRPTSGSAVLTDSQSPVSGAPKTGLTRTESRVLKALCDGTPKSFADLIAAGIAKSSLNRALPTLVGLGRVLKDATTRQPRYRLNVEGKSCDAVRDRDPSANSGAVPSSATTLKGGTVGPPGGNAATRTNFLPPRTTQAASEVAHGPGDIGAAA